jgi:hypothetical protein
MGGFLSLTGSVGTAVGAGLAAVQSVKKGIAAGQDGQQGQKQKRSSHSVLFFCKEGEKTKTLQKDSYLFAGPLSQKYVF